jgi:Raf kinase inhibitor-like YbhB/YbcL family protein
MTTRVRLPKKSSVGRARGKGADLGLKSSSFGPNESIPVRHTADGQNVSPPLTWEAPPKGTQSLALLCEDPDAPTPTPFIHWLVANIDPGQSSRMLSEGVRLMSGAVLGKTSFGQTGYGGPEPPRGHGIHHYHFKLFALDTTVPLQEGFSKEHLLLAMKGHLLGSSDLVGTYRR